MDRMFLDYYEAELEHIRALATEFAALNPNAAGSLSIDTTPCPDPYVERLLEGVAYLAARTRLKLDVESSRYVRTLLDTLYPDLAGPAPAMTLAQMEPGPQVDTMLDGHLMRRGTRMIAGLREGLRTRATYTTSEDVHLWPVTLTDVTYLQDRSALVQAGVSDAASRDVAAGLRIRLARRGAGRLADLSLDALTVHFGMGPRGGPLFDAVFGAGQGALARAAGSDAPYRPIGRPQMVGIGDETGLLPRVRPSFEGYRLLREYFLMPARFHGMRLSGLSPAVRVAKDDGQGIEIVVPLGRADPALSALSTADLRLHVTPVVNLFEHECNLVELRPGRSSHTVHADRTRPKDFEIYRLLRVEDAETEGPDARIAPLFSVAPRPGERSGYVYTAERRPRRPDTDEVRRGQTRSSYIGDDFQIAISDPGRGPRTGRLRRLDIRALCTNRDLPILDDNPTLTLETGDPVGRVKLLGAMRRPRSSLRASLPSGAKGEAKMDDLSWRWIAQLSLNHLSLAADGADAAPLRALIQLYADRGDPDLARHGEALERVRSGQVMDRLALPGPIAFGHGTEITLDINETLLGDGSELLLSAILAQLFSRHTATNSFVRTKTRLMRRQTEVRWPTTPGTRAPI
ncbi:type VI secretion system baseplate subunit TssF [Jannaschia seohaensis]|uniref:Type VI secretion system protein ImpG n=1 Tax=Jannaschia seohaensis TaxID=475081 RepID=A0A2Y9AY25_9RHOB|nr:type VI secretion system baseplate subunit TssF [Jannaschia seohaensis]PWJ16558.1 type VI secretion system protein ImpG [Jannaschia seohaensis]SSA48795.1 type VI secretion system protein ImpG [Jannaschia seohaensis]